MKAVTVLGAPIDCSGRGRGEILAPGALRSAGLVEGLGARDDGDLPVAVDDSTRDPVTGVIGGAQLRRAVAVVRAEAAALLRRGERPVVVGGDCTVLIGAAAAARDVVGPFDLVFVDGHPDYLDGRTSPTGEAADMDLSVVTGLGPAGLLDPGGPDPIVDPERAVLIGHRSDDTDPDAVVERGRLPPELARFDAAAVVEEGGDEIARLATAGRDGPWWLHLDLDVLDAAALPAVTYPAPGGPGWDDLAALVTGLSTRAELVGVTVADFRPDLDPDGRYARRIVGLLAAGLASASR
jgi:arginase